MELLLPQPRALAPADLLALYDTPGPYVRAGMVVSLDGAASYDGTSRALQSPGDLQVFATLRAVADVVLVGAGTARAERYGPVRLSEHARAWRAAHGRRPGVPLAVVSAALDLPPDAEWLTGPGTIVVTCGAAPPDRRARLAEAVEVLVCGAQTVDLAGALDRLAERGLERVLCEGGPSLLGTLTGAGLVTEVCATLSPLLAGGAGGLLPEALPATVPLELAHLVREQSTLLGRWLLR